MTKKSTYVPPEHYKELYKDRFLTYQKYLRELGKRVGNKGKQYFDELFLKDIKEQKSLLNKQIDLLDTYIKNLEKTKTFNADTGLWENKPKETIKYTLKFSSKPSKPKENNESKKVNEDLEAAKSYQYLDLLNNSLEDLFALLQFIKDTTVEKSENEKTEEKTVDVSDENPKINNSTDSTTPTDTIPILPKDTTEVDILKPKKLEPKIPMTAAIPEESDYEFPIWSTLGTILGISTSAVGFGMPAYKFAKKYSFNKAWKYTPINESYKKIRYPDALYSVNGDTWSNKHNRSPRTEKYNKIMKNIAENHKKKPTLRGRFSKFFGKGMGIASIIGLLPMLFPTELEEKDFEKAKVFEQRFGRDWRNNPYAVRLWENSEVSEDGNIQIIS